MTGKIGRPSSAQTETVLVQDMDSHEVIAWSDGNFAGASGELKHLARRLYAAEAEVQFTDGTTARIEHNARGAALAMIAACSGRGRILSTEHGSLPTDTRIV